MIANRRARSPGAHWILFALVLGSLLIALLLEGYSNHEVGRSATPVAVANETALEVPGGAAVVYQDGDRLASRALPERTVALTFDDGPDPRWTPQVLRILREAGVPATFFVTGTRTIEHADLVRRELDDGHEIGNHSYAHADLSGVPAWRRNLELSLTQLSTIGTTGRASALLRPPYTSVPAALTQRDAAMLRRATGAGYLVVLSDVDSQDWRRPGVDAIVRNAMPAGDAGAIVLFHDAGGDRSQTLAALPRVIEELKARGYRFATVSDALGLQRDAAMQPVGGLRRAQGLGLVAATQLADVITAGVLWLLVPLGLLAVLRTLLLLGFARWHSVRASRRPDDPSYTPPVSVIVPAYNEAVGIAATVRTIAASDYPDLEIVVVDDGSTDGTADIVAALDLPGVKVIRQENAGKAAALNAGIWHSRGDVLVMVDGDTVFEPDTIRWLVQPLRRRLVGAVSGNTKVGNRRGLLGRWQHLEYVVGFNLDRRMYDLLRCMPTVPGAIGAFTRQALDAVGGVGEDTLAEDTDLTMAVNRAGYRVVYEERARAWTEAPATLAALWRQRYRWCYGTLQAVWKHRAALRSRGPGSQLGRIGLPYLLAFQVVLPLVAPIIDVFAIYGLLFLDPVRVAIYWLAFLSLQLVAGAYALHLDREPLRVLWSLPLQQFVYRQLMYLVVVQSVVSALSGVRLRWHKLERTGDLEAAPTNANA